MSKILDALNVRRATLKAALEAANEATIVDGEARSMTAEESTSFDAQIAEIRAVDARIAEVAELDAAEARAAAGRVASGIVLGSEPATYRKGDASRSYFRDFRAAKQGDTEARERLIRNDRERVVEQRALTTAAGAGGEFAPPLWLVNEFIKLARPARKMADSIGTADLPSGVSSINLPKVSGGTSTAVQATQNTALSQTDMTTTSVTSGISTYGGKQVVSLQLLQQSGIPFDEVILQDIAADYAKSFGSAVINGSGAGGQLSGVYTYFTASGTVNQTYTSASPTVGALYSKVMGAAAAIETARFFAPDCIWMHPRRWAWIMAATDTQGRPLVVPDGAMINGVGTASAMVPQGTVGTFGGLPVVTDANIPTTTGAGTQDPVLIGYKEDLRIWESAVRTEVFDAPYADSMGILFRLYAYSAAIPNRYTTSLAVINGTGLIAPTF